MTLADRGLYSSPPAAEIVADGSAYVPSRRANRPTDAQVTEARCMCGGYVACPRHRPADYADSYARHATDSFGPFVSAHGGVR